MESVDEFDESADEWDDCSDELDELENCEEVGDGNAEASVEDRDEDAEGEEGGEKFADDKREREDGVGVGE